MSSSYQKRRIPTFYQSRVLSGVHTCKLHRRLTCTNQFVQVSPHVWTGSLYTVQVDKRGLQNRRHVKDYSVQTLPFFEACAVWTGVMPCLQSATRGQLRYTLLLKAPRSKQELKFARAYLKRVDTHPILPYLHNLYRASKACTCGHRFNDPLKENCLKHFGE